MSVRAIAKDGIVDTALAANCPVAIGVSGGKDSQAAAIATVRHLDAIGHAGPVVLVHSDLGTVEWNDSLPTCERLADHLGIELVVVRRQAGDMMERWEARWRSSVERYEQLSTVTLVPCWSTPAMRFCTSELKTHVIRAALKRRYPAMTVVNVTGIRRAESAARAKATVANQERDHPVINWRPILDWTEAEVFEAIERSGLDPHPAYRQFRMSRVSCRFCIMSNVADLTAAAAQSESHQIYRRMVSLECDSSFAFQGGRWLGDIAPQLLGDQLAHRLAEAKSRASARALIERRITPGMLYVKGWPLRMLTDNEADILADVRAEISALFGFNSKHLSRQSIHDRYAGLIAEHSLAKPDANRQLPLV